jgi:peroxiredoxin
MAELGSLRGLFAALLLAAGLVAGCDSSAPRLNAGDPAPPFKLMQPDGKAVSFPEDFRGKPVVVRFWAEWCRFCEKEMKDIEQVWQRHKDQGLTVLAVNVGQDKPSVENYVRKIGVNYPPLLDEKSETARRYGVVGLPTTYFVDREGRIRSKVLGEAEKETFERLAAEAMK